MTVTYDFATRKRLVPTVGYLDAAARGRDRVNHAHVANVLRARADRENFASVPDPLPPVEPIEPDPECFTLAGAQPSPLSVYDDVIVSLESLTTKQAWCLIGMIAVSIGLVFLIVTR